ncbi:MAG TPA: cation:proton antiporter [Flavipsychrobacter sp.]|nr:cation:proton antiporter [Flavipsychrobacter sp.]
MLLLASLDFSLPLTNPVIIFSLVLFIILFAPILLNKIKVPHIIGLIVAGILVGPYGFNFLTRDSSIVLFGTVGLLYIMFLAGLEIDLAEFKKNTKKILFFGLATFALPFVFGTLASYYLLGYSFMSSMLLASMFSTHTLVAYPIASKYGIIRNKAVTLVIGGTMITDILALLILAIIAGMTKEDVSSMFWVKLGVSTIAFVGIIFFLFPPVIRWFFKKFEDSISQYIFVLATVFLSAFLAEAAGIEAIIGAFFSGLVLNKFIPHQSALMNRINFVGNAIFIPFFLIGVGMLVDVKVIMKGWDALKVAGVIISVAIVTKYLAAWITQRVFGMSVQQRRLMFGLSTAHAAATLAIILVGYNIIIGETAAGVPIRLLNEDVLNGTILLILFSCAISSFVVEKAARTIVTAPEGHLDEDATSSNDEKILVSILNMEMVVPMMDLALMLKPGKSKAPVYALQVVDDTQDNKNGGVAMSKKVLDRAVMHGSASENTIIPIIRYDANIANGMIYTIKEQQITDTLIGLHQQANQQVFFGATAEKVLRRNWGNVYIYKPIQPFNTLKRIVTLVPDKAETEPGFVHWYKRITTIAAESGMPLYFYSSSNVLEELQLLSIQANIQIQIHFKEYTHWDYFADFSKELKADDFLVLVTARKNTSSYQTYLNKLSQDLPIHFTENSFLILYPEQLEIGINMENIEQSDGALIETITDKIEAIGNVGRSLKNLFKKK